MWYNGAMKGDHLGEFEELTLLAACALRDEAYGVTVQQYLERASGRKVTMGAVYASLDRLERKGLLRSTVGDVTPERGGKRKRLFTITPTGQRRLRDVRDLRNQLWEAIEGARP
jgi:DNA-binding PadR family transcriptional regulator